LLQRLEKRGLQVEADGRMLFIGLDGREPYDMIRDEIVELGVGLLRLEQRRHSLEDLFRPEEVEATDA
jgi:ABC-2 type transport system ATP-binding protein